MLTLVGIVAGWIGVGLAATLLMGRFIDAGKGGKSSDDADREQAAEPGRAAETKDAASRRGKGKRHAA